MWDFFPRHTLLGELWWSWIRFVFYANVCNFNRAEYYKTWSVKVSQKLPLNYKLLQYVIVCHAASVNMTFAGQYPNNYVVLSVLFVQILSQSKHKCSPLTHLLFGKCLNSSTMHSKATHFFLVVLSTFCCSMCQLTLHTVCCYTNVAKLLAVPWLKLIFPAKNIVPRDSYNLFPFKLI